MENYTEQDRCKMYGMGQMDKNYYTGMCGMYNMPMGNNFMECKNKMYEFNPYMKPQGCNVCNNGYPMMHMNFGRGYGYPMMQMEPIENMCSTYKMLIVYVEKSISKIMMENMGMMPNAISKEKYHKEMNEMLCEVMKKEKELKELVVVDRLETEDKEDMDRNMCPYCGGFLKDTLGILFLTELLKRGCVSCY